MDEHTTGHHHRYKWLLIIVVMLLGIAGISLRLSQGRHQSPFSASVRDGASFPLYYPESLPPGFTIDKKSIVLDNDVVIYALRAPGGIVVNISIQKRPADSVLDQFYKDGLQDIRTVATRNGMAKIGTLEGRQALGSLVTNTSWILAASTDKSLTNQLQQILTSLKIDH